jgi:hypothetical protein
VTALLALSAAVWLIAVPWLVFKGLVESAGFWGEAPDLAGASVSFTWAAWLGAGIPLVGVVVSATTHRRGETWFFAICLVVVAAVTTLKLASDARRAPPAPPGPRHCVERSGGGTECPGG